MSNLLAILLKYRYFALFPIAAVEGPVVSLIVGFLIFSGHFQFLPSYIILIFGDVVPDTVYYYLGRYGNHKKLIEKYSSRLVFVSKNFHLVEKLWRDHPVKTMFFSKLAYGLSTPFLISAGLVKMPFRKFISLTLPITLLQYLIIISVGYYLGHSYSLAQKYIENAGIFVVIVGFIFVSLILTSRSYVKTQLSQLEKDELNKKDIKQ